jgi:hypothetical protein
VKHSVTAENRQVESVVIDKTLEEEGVGSRRKKVDQSNQHVDGMQLK